MWLPIVRLVDSSSSSNSRSDISHTRTMLSRTTLLHEASADSSKHNIPDETIDSPHAERLEVGMCVWELSSNKAIHHEIPCASSSFQPAPKQRLRYAPMHFTASSLTEPALDRSYRRRRAAHMSGLASDGLKLPSHFRTTWSKGLAHLKSDSSSSLSASVLPSCSSRLVLSTCVAAASLLKAAFLTSKTSLASTCLSKATVPPCF
mmetsp:Transcript_2816/g.10244  ORF Transcript_2816/g.10244 Transcript_2816/m.10244 type:complete len:205 (+) Transcript_2816:2460-3074(+)